MTDVNVLDMLFNGDSSILDFKSNSHPNSEAFSTTDSDGLHPEQQHSSIFGGDLHPYQYHPENTKMLNLTSGVLDSEWPSSLLSPTLDSIDHNEFFTALLDSNLPDDEKQQQVQHIQHKTVSDHAYSINPASPHSDSGVSSTGAYSPSSGHDVDDLTFDVDRDLFGPLGLEKYSDMDSDLTSSVSPMLLDSISDCSSSSPVLAGNESPVRFDFEEFGGSPTQTEVKDLTISTDETTKVIKVLSVNGTAHNQNLQQYVSKKPIIADSPYPELMLSDEEKDLLRKEGIVLPSHLPLTRDEEKVLRSVRRRIRNKASARNSRRKKQDYMEALEKRVKRCTDEKRQLEKKVIDLEKRNSSLIGQLKKLQRLVTDSTRQTAKTGTCAMILALSFALVLLPNYRSLVGNESTQDALVNVPSNTAGRQARSLLSKSDDFASPSQYADKPVNYIPFTNLGKMVTPSSIPIDDPVDDGDDHLLEPIDDMMTLKRGGVSSCHNEKVIHMEITKLPDDKSEPPTLVHSVNGTSKDDTSATVEKVRHPHLPMEVGDEL
ncbi:cyclic AMP-responsive element-binding protein 3-like protein 3 [Watersipora subatra]|uniref:cyclic AMP-responsive element-binding protein 3-like protein 3 n=1 Tax=Watersipora subatra TaxID=2589382 RepID=UPI00355B701B